MSKDSIEYEAKVLNIDVKEIVGKIEKVGGVKVKDYTFRRYVFDTIPKQDSRWVRLRTDGSATTLTVKEIGSDEIDGTSEWEIEVSDLDTTLKILEKIGITSRGYQENLRTEYRINDAEVSIDSWPHLNPYIEIEARNAAQVEETAKLLGYQKSDLTSVNTEKLYEEIGMDLKKISKLQFEEK